MEPTTINAIIAGVVGLVTGAIGSLIAPWVNWGIEKRRRKYERRIEMVKRWREILSRDDFNRSHLLNDPAYGPLRDLLDKSVIEGIERSTKMVLTVAGSPTNNSDRDIILREVARVEKSWKLM